MLTFVCENPTSDYLDFAMTTVQSRLNVEAATDEFSPEVEFAILTLRKFFESSDINLLQPNSPNTVYTTAVTLWLLILQRLKGGISQQAAVKEMIDNLPGFVPDNKRVCDALLSSGDSSYNQARKRLNLQTVTELLDRISMSIVRQARMPGERLRVLIDGTTFTLPPTRELKEAFPPAINQLGESVWPVMMVFVAHELNTGCAIKPEIGAMYGNKTDSELKMARRIFLRLPPQSIVVGDAGLGIFSVAHGAVACGHDVVLRLSKSRFKSLTKKATQIFDNTWSLVWTPTAKERKTTPDLPADANVEVRIHRMEVNGEEIYLATSLLRLSRPEAFDIYKCRQDVETDIGDIKVTMDTENIRAKTREGVLKELYTSIIAYNSVIQFRRDAARVANKPPRQLSFKGTLDTFRIFLSDKLLRLEPQQCIAQYAKALQIASKDIIRHRPGRNYKREAHPRRPKTTKWQKQQAKAKRKTNVENECLNQKQNFLTNTT
jgi:hypothetical protein